MMNYYLEQYIINRSDNRSHNRDQEIAPTSYPIFVGETSGLDTPKCQIYCAPITDVRKYNLTFFTLLDIASGAHVGAPLRGRPAFLTRY